VAELHAIQLYQGNVVSVNPTRTNLYTVPAGRRIIVRSVASRNLNGGSSQAFYVYVNATVVYTVLATSGGSSGGSNEFRPWLVLGPGDILGAAAATSTGFGVVASGSTYTI
jgi:hypothetical protein